MAEFIGISALSEIAKKYEKEIAMGAVYFRPDVFERMKIKVISGLQFKSIKHVMNRKGHTTVRKVVGTPVNSTIGYIEEREMVCHLTWNHFTDNKDNYIEKAIVDVDGSADFSYPLSELAMQAALANYGEDLFDCLWHGDDTIAANANNAYLRLYTGFVTYLAEDIAMGRISTTNGNLVSATAISRPTATSDISAWNAFLSFRDAWTQNLKNAPEVLVYCNDVTGAAIAAGYFNANGTHQKVDYVGNGNFKVQEFSNITFCPESSMGTGYKLIATVPYNFEYGVNTLDSRTKISVREGSDVDHDDISYQVQSVQGTRVLQVGANKFCMTDATLTATPGAGDYTKNTFDFMSNNTTYGTVAATTSAGSVTTGSEVAAGTVVTLTASAESGGQFLRWSNGQTADTITVAAPNQPFAIVAIFAAQ